MHLLDMCCWRSILRKPPLKPVPTEGADLLCNARQCLPQLFAAAVPSLLYLPLDHPIFHAKQLWALLFLHNLLNFCKQEPAKLWVYHSPTKEKIIQTLQGHLLNGQQVRGQWSNEALDSTLSPPVCLSHSESLGSASSGNKIVRMEILHDRLPCSDFL